MQYYTYLLHAAQQQRHKEQQQEHHKMMMAAMAMVCINTVQVETPTIHDFIVVPSGAKFQKVHKISAKSENKKLPPANFP